MVDRFQNLEMIGVGVHCLLRRVQANSAWDGQPLAPRCEYLRN